MALLRLHVTDKFRSLNVGHDDVEDRRDELFARLKDLVGLFAVARRYSRKAFLFDNGFYEPQDRRIIIRDQDARWP